MVERHGYKTRQIGKEPVIRAFVALHGETHVEVRKGLPGGGLFATRANRPPPDYSHYSLIHEHRRKEKRF